jgi:hypothetical protein
MEFRCKTEVFTVVKIQVEVFWTVMCSGAVGYQLESSLP